MSDTVANFHKVRRKDLYLSVVNAAKDVPETSRHTLQNAVYLFCDDISELSSHILHIILFTHLVNAFVIIAAVFTGYWLYMACAVIITVLAIYLNRFRLAASELLPAAKLLAESDNNGPPYSPATCVFWY